MGERREKILVLGGTGAMGTYLTPLLASLGYTVDAVCLDREDRPSPNLRYRIADAMDRRVLASLLKPGYDCIVDFMLYDTKQYAERFETLLGSCGHYIQLSSYRVYSDLEVPTRETSPRLLDSSSDAEFLATEDYSLYKAREENIVRASRFRNWTVVRPAITYSKFRYQLVTLEAPILIRRALEGKPVLLPESAMEVEATMTWAGDVAKMFAGLVCNPRAMGECYSLCTAEHHPWKTVAEYYRDLVGLRYEVVPDEIYLSMQQWPSAAGYQLYYDRCFQRVMDNSKILAAAGLRQEELTPLYEGLKRELSALPKDHVWPESHVCAQLDRYFALR